MELNLRKQPLFISEALIDTTMEQPVECDALLPDYCPDIVRILKCMVSPAIAGRRLKGQQLDIEGMTEITVFYISSGEGIHKAEYKVPFSRTIELKSEPAKAAVSVQARPGYVNCRAVNQRRLDIRGAITLCCFVMGSREEQVVCGGEGAGIQLREEVFSGSRLVGQESREIRLNETLELAYGKPPIQEIIRCHACQRLIECKAGDGKAVVKGELTVHMLYQHTGGCDQMDFTIPTAAVLELDGLDDSCSCAANQEVTLCSLEPVVDQEGDCRTVTLDACLLVTVRAECPYTATCCTDCYSTKCHSDYKAKTYNTMRLETTLKEPVTIREVMQLPENIETVLDLWCEPSAISYRGEQGGIIADGRIVVSMLCRMRDGEIYYFDKNMELTERLAAPVQNPVLDGRIAVTGSGYSFTAGDSIEVRCDLVLDCSIYSTQKCTCIEEVTLDEKKPGNNTVSPGLYLYMAGDNEAVWDIAKRYNTSVQRIAEENPAGEGRRGDVLIIPVL